VGERGDPYRVLVSEAMLQQTQVATVVDYYERFMAALPTIEALAGAAESRVLRLWQGLGYYRRARHLHRAAKAIVARYGGRVPDDVDALRELPGVGRYTAGAVASIAFGRRAAVVDGNVSRVLARLLAIGEAIDAPHVARRLWGEAEALLPAARRGAKHTPGDFNQAMMELGATVCTPKAPQCRRCPVRRFCAAAGQGDATAYPIARRRAAVRAVLHRVVVVRKGRRVLIERRGDDGLWAGMWQAPTFESNGQSRPSSRGLRGAVAERFGVTIGAPVRLTTFEHLTTHRRICFAVWSAEATGGRLRRGAGAWRTVESLDELPLSNPQRRVLAAAANGGAEKSKR